MFFNADAEKTSASNSIKIMSDKFEIKTQYFHPFH